MSHPHHQATAALAGRVRERFIEARLATSARLAEDLERIMRRVTGTAEVLVDQSLTPEGPVAIPKPGEKTY